MIHYSFSTVMMTIISSNLILILLTVCFHNTKLLVSIGYKALALFLGLTLVRFLLPFQFPFARNLELSGFLSRLVAFCRHVFYENGFLKLSLWSIFEFIWIIGFLILLAVEIRRYFRCKQYITEHGLDITLEEPYRSIMKQICNGRKNPFRIIRLPGCQIPRLHGISSPCILFSSDLALSEKEIYYILCHETSHYFHHDVLLKSGINLLCMIYWWNPACRILKQQLDIIIEMRVDKSVVGTDHDAIVEYTSCLLTIAQNAIDNGEPKSDFNASLIKGTKDTLLSRFHMMSTPRKKSTKFLNALLLALIIGIYAFSYCFIWEARYSIPKDTESTLAMSSDNTYAVLNADGSYSIYFGDILIEVTETLEHYPADIPVYDSISESPANNGTTNLK